MSTESFAELAGAQWQAGRFLCVGLDSDWRLLGDPLPLPASSPGGIGRQAIFNRAIIDATSDIAAAFKPNSAFYEAQGAQGILDLCETVKYIKATAPQVPVILDAKRADIGNTNRGYVDFAFEYLGVDAITVHPYLGSEALGPFLERSEKGIFVLCRTSNAGAAEFQDVEDADGQRLFERIAVAVATTWNGNGNCGLVVGSTYPRDLARVRSLAAGLPFLIPGIGSQGGDLDASVRAGLTRDRTGIFVNASSSIIFKSRNKDFAYAARVEAARLHEAILAARTGG